MWGFNLGNEKLKSKINDSSYSYDDFFTEK